MYHLAQVNIGRLRAPLEAPEITDFRENLVAINTLAEQSPGFVWRYTDSSGNATDTRPYDDDTILFNMSVWDSVEALKAYVYRSQHGAFFKRRAEWFQKFDGVYTALWWIPAGRTPTIADAKVALAHLEAHGPTARAFTFAHSFPPPSERLNVSSGAKWEDIVGYSRAVRIGNTIEVAGTTAVGADGAVVGPGDVYTQTLFTLRKMERALIQAGASLRDVVRTRIYLTDVSQWEAAGRAHGECFRDIKPASTMLEVSKLIDPALLVEIEATAILRD